MRKGTNEQTTGSSYSENGSCRVPYGRAAGHGRDKAPVPERKTGMVPNWFIEPAAADQLGAGDHGSPRRCELLTFRGPAGPRLSLLLPRAGCLLGAPCNLPSFYKAAGYLGAELGGPRFHFLNGKDQ